MNLEAFDNSYEMHENKTVLMWSVINGTCTRTNPPTTLMACLVSARSELMTVTLRCAGERVKMRMVYNGYLGCVLALFSSPLRVVHPTPTMSHS